MLERAPDILFLQSLEVLESFIQVSRSTGPRNTLESLQLVLVPYVLKPCDTGPVLRCKWVGVLRYRNVSNTWHAC